MSLRTYAAGTILVALVALCSCSSTGKYQAPSLSASGVAVEAPARPLTEQEAETRFKQIGHIRYGLSFELTDATDGYSGQATIHFDLRKPGSDLFLDFRGGPAGTIRSLTVNGNAVQDPSTRYDGNRIHFFASELHSGVNEIEIAFSRKYGTNGHGLYHFKDSEDGKTYLYTDDEPAFAHEVFPCFDQPDLKATYELTVSAPSAWVVVANAMETRTSIADGKKTWVFPPTQPLSTYLFALIAGDYVSWTSDADGIPVRLFARASLKRYLDSSQTGDAREWLEITRQGLDFYATQFGHPYPYGKYDQILVPDFDEGAMENAGAVTFMESLAYRTKKTRLQHLDRANIVLHEMAHMWFGDLVTMKWWNGLWLNESFATFMSAWSVADATKFKESWQSFTGDDKAWAYWQDQLVTTHPIDLPVPDTDHAFSNFDGITYGKGAAVLKQLRFFLGQDDFIDGIQRYFQRYAQKNSTLHDFIRMLSEASDVNLKTWQAAWLKTPGMNTVKAQWACTPDERGTSHGISKISSFSLIQGNAAESTVLRPHKTQVALFTQRSGKLVARDLIPVSYSGESTTVDEAIGKNCPDFVYPNYGDEDYVKVVLDDLSLERMTRGLRTIEDPLTRQMYWEDLWNMVIEGTVSPKRYVETALENLTSEHDLLVIQNILDNVSQSRLSRDSAMKFIAPSERAQLEDRLERVLLKNLRGAQPGSDLQLAYFNAFVDGVRTPSGLEFVRELLSKKERLSGLKIDSDLRWALVTALARNGAPDALERIDAENAADPSHLGEIKRFTALAEIPSQQNKASWFEKIVAAGDAGGSTKELSASDLHAIMSNLPIIDQEDQIASLLPQYFNYLPKAAHSPDEEFTSNYTRSLYPGICSAALVDLTTQALNGSAAASFPAEALKQLKTHLQEETRCTRARSSALK